MKQDILFYKHYGPQIFTRWHWYLCTKHHIVLYSNFLPLMVHRDPLFQLLSHRSHTSVGSHTSQQNFKYFTTIFTTYI